MHDHDAYERPPSHTSTPTSPSLSQSQSTLLPNPTNHKRNSQPTTSSPSRPSVMAQGILKKPSAPKQSNAANKSTGITKKGARTFKPKNAKVIKQAKMNKKFTGGLTAQTEKMLGERAGHLELLGQGRKKTSGAGVGGGEKKGMAKAKSGKK